MKFLPIAIFTLVATMPLAARSSACTATSGERRVPVLELYTSQGCDSCPPTDRWVSSLPARGYTADRLVTLAFHVDYWDRLGWPDPYAQQRFSERQRHIAARNAARVVYTPQLVLNGRDYRRPIVRDDLNERIASLNQEPPRATLSLTLHPTAHTIATTGQVSVPAPSDRGHAHVFLALSENNIGNSVTAGENRGKRLAHDFVVRELVGPLHPDAGGNASLQHVFKLDPRWKRPDLTVSAFVQHQISGATLQALSLSNCK